MNEEQVLEFNRLCAKFIGLPFDGIMYRNSYEVMEFFNYLDYSRYPSELEFHSNWIWIMAVIDAIEKVNLTPIENLNCFIVSIEKNICEIKANNYFSLAFKSLSKSFHNSNPYIVGLSEPEAVIQAINNFLIWYNETKVNPS